VGGRTRRFSELAVLLVAAAVAPSFARAQTVVANTFGPGSSYGLGSRDVWYAQSIAEGFGYSGSTGLFLAQIRLALRSTDAPYTISFLQGTDMNSATTLESWSAPGTLDGINTFSSVPLTLISGDMYWVAAAGSGQEYGGWYWNDHVFDGVWVVGPPLHGPTWYECSGCWSGAYDVTVTPVSVTPEPATLLLLGTGLAGIGGVIRRRRRKSTES
jgi:hypothetical protein